MLLTYMPLFSSHDINAKAVYTEISATVYKCFRRQLHM